MKKISLQWRLTIITTLFIAAICGCLTMFVYQNGVYYIDSLQNAIDSKIDDGSGKHSDELYISIPDEEWDDFANNFSIQVSNNKVDYKKKQSLYFYTVSSSWWSSNILYQWSSTKTTRRFFQQNRRS